MERFAAHSSWIARTDVGAGVRPEANTKQLDALKDEIAAQYDILRAPVFGYLITTGVNAGDAEDILQEAFLRAYERLAHSPERDHNIRAWIFKVAHNLAINHLKRERRVTYGLNLSDIAALPRTSIAPSAEETALKQEEIDRTRTALTKLTAHELQCLRLRAQGLRYREIAEIVGTGISTVAEAVARGCRKIAS